MTVLIATYNPSIEKLRNTIRSILFQENIVIEIVITDDGSVIFPRKEVEDTFLHYKFSNYKIIENKKNKGTVNNLLTGVHFCSGNYIKLISPGDYLYSADTLFCLYREAMNNKSDISFGDVVYYDKNFKKIKLLKHLASPQNTIPYKKENFNEIKFNYLIMNDTIHGVATLCKKEILQQYLFEFSEKIKFAEDCLYRIMIYDGLKVSYCPKNVALYEYGNGISTNKAEKWKQIIHNDLLATDEIIIKKMKTNKDKEIFYCSIQYRDSKSLGNLIKLMVKEPRFIIQKIKNKFFRRYTNMTFDSTFCKHTLGNEADY